MATPIAHKGVTAGARVIAMTLMDLFLDPSLVAAAKEYFAEQTADHQYSPLIGPNDPPVRRGFVFPAGQLDDRGRPPVGLERVVPCFADGYSAWMWLKSPHPALDGAVPLDLLKRGHAESVVAAAQGDMQGDFM